MAQRGEKSDKPALPSLKSTDFSWGEQENNFPWLHYLTCISVCYPALEADVLRSSFGQKNFPQAQLCSDHDRGSCMEQILWHWDLHSHSTQGFVSLSLCQLLGGCLGAPSNPSRGATKPMALQGQAQGPGRWQGLLASSSRGQWPILPMRFISSQRSCQGQGLIVPGTLQSE